MRTASEVDRVQPGRDNRAGQTTDNTTDGATSATAYDQIYLLGLLVAALAMFAWGRWRYDMVALATLLAATVAGTVPFADAFAGFGHPATVTVVFVLIISRGLTNSGAVDLIARHLLPPVESASAHVGILSGTAGALSTIMNNVGALALLMPAVLQSAIKVKRPALLILMPLAFGSLLGAMTPIGHQNNTLIMGPGGYHFGDYWRMGLPLSIVVAAVAVPMLLWVWPM